MQFNNMIKAALLVLILEVTVVVADDRPSRTTTSNDDCIYDQKVDGVCSSFCRIARSLFSTSFILVFHRDLIVNYNTTYDIHGYRACERAGETGENITLEQAVQNGTECRRPTVASNLGSISALEFDSCGEYFNEDSSLNLEVYAFQSSSDDCNFKYRFLLVNISSKLVVFVM